MVHPTALENFTRSNIVFATTNRKATAADPKQVGDSVALLPFEILIRNNDDSKGAVNLQDLHITPTSSFCIGWVFLS